MHNGCSLLGRVTARGVASGGSGVRDFLVVGVFVHSCLLLPLFALAEAQFHLSGMARHRRRW